MAINAFLGDTSQQKQLYGDEGRLRDRTASLIGSRIAGSNPIYAAIAELKLDSQLRSERIIDIGCGRGSSTALLEEHLRPNLLVGFDLSSALLATMTKRASSALAIEGDFHSMPFIDESFDLAFAAFCLYHSSRPEHVCAEINRVLRSGGKAALFTKNIDSYCEIDQFLVSTGLITAASEPSLYESFCTENAIEVVGRSCKVDTLHHEKHEFQFDADSLYRYICTTPKFKFVEGLPGAETFYALVPKNGLRVTSIVTTVLATKRG